MPSEDDSSAQDATREDHAKVYSRKAFAVLIGRSVSTLRAWERSGLLSAHRYPSGRPFYTEDQLRSVLSEPKE